MIVDNADDLEELYKRRDENDQSIGPPALADYLPSSQQGSILLTTRNHMAAVKHAGVDVITIKEMSESESLKLLKESLIDKSLIAEKDTAKLLQLLTYLPLAIKQAAAFINEQQVSIHDYLEACNSGDQELIQLLRENFEDQGRYESIQNPIALTWLISFRHIQQYDLLAAKYLNIMSCLAAQDIPHSFLPEASKSEEIKAIGILKAYAFITLRKGGKSYDMHRLVQLVMRNWLKTTGELTRWTCETLKQAARIFPLCEHGNRDVCTLYLPHVQYILKFHHFPEDVRDLLRNLISNVGGYFYYTGKYIEAEKMLQQALGDDHPPTLYSMNNLAIVLRQQGRYAEAETLHRQTLELKKKALGDDHPSTLSSMNNLANVLEERGRYAEAETLHRQTLELMKEALGDDHPSTLGSMSNLAEVFRQQGKVTEAETLQRQTFELKKEALGDDHPLTLGSMNNLAEVLRHQGRYAEAETLHRQTLELKKKALGDDHPSTLSSMNNLARVLEHQGNYAEAEMLRKEYKVRTKE
jgi:tetratricopeptide (TPR) repeat protein